MTYKQESLLYDRQLAFIKRKCGAKQEMNLGWFVDDESITTKLYAHPTIFSITSYWVGKRAKHDINLHEDHVLI